MRWERLPSEARHLFLRREGMILEFAMWGCCLDWDPSQVVGRSGESASAISWEQLLWGTLQGSEGMKGDYMELVNLWAMWNLLFPGTWDNALEMDPNSPQHRALPYCTLAEGEGWGDREGEPETAREMDHTLKLCLWKSHLPYWGDKGATIWGVKSKC